MNDAHQLALAMFVLACVAMTLVAGQLYMQQGMDTKTTTPKHLQTATLGVSPPAATPGHARPDLVMARRP